MNLLAPPSNAAGNSLSVSGSVSSAPPVKVPLKRGRSLMDWVRLCNDKSNNLTGVANGPLKVDESLLMKHNRTGDAWTVINGDVYNISAYVEYHPGGTPELMRVAGTDGTALFNQVHPWVNYQSMMERCLVGKFVGRLSELPPPKPSDERSGGETFKLQHFNIRITDEWDTERNRVHLQVLRKKYSLSRRNVFAELAGTDRNTVRLILLSSHADSLPLHISMPLPKPADRLEISDLDDVDGIGISVRFTKPTAPLRGYLQNEARVTQTKDLCYVRCAVKSVSPITRQSVHIVVDVPDRVHMPLPVAHHVRIRHRISEYSVVDRAYTPVPANALDGRPEFTFNDQLHFLIKIYSDGKLTPAFRHLTAGSSIEVSNAHGTFDVVSLKQTEELVMIAAGTGITPMFRLMQYWNYKFDDRPTPLLLNFNRTSCDVIWAEELQAEHDAGKVALHNFYSESKSDARSLSAELLGSLLGNPTGRRVLICVCGPSGFNEKAVKYLTKLGFEATDVHVFEG